MAAPAETPRASEMFAEVFDRFGITREPDRVVEVSTVGLEWLDEEGHLSADSHPASLVIDPRSGEVIAERWMLHGVPHRIDGPASIISPAGVRGWYGGGTMYRDDAPLPEPSTLVEWALDGQVFPSPQPVQDRYLEVKFGVKVSEAARRMIFADRSDWHTITSEQIELATTLYPDYAEA